MPKKAKCLFVDFENHTHSLERTRKKMESLLTAGYIDDDDISAVYSGLFLNVFTEFEKLIEELFFGLLTGKLYIPSATSLSGSISPSSSKVKRLMKISPITQIQSIVSGGKSYLDWLPYDNHTKPRAERFFDGGRPFHILSSNQISNLKYYHVIRNAIAHKSPKSQNEFKNIISALTLLPHEKTPPGYLRSKPQASTTQYEIAISELKVIASELCTMKKISP